MIFEEWNDNTAKESVVILIYDGGDFYRFYTAPTVQLALELERYVQVHKK